MLHVPTISRSFTRLKVMSPLNSSNNGGDLHFLPLLVTQTFTFRTKRRDKILFPHTISFRDLKRTREDKPSRSEPKYRLSQHHFRLIFIITKSPALKNTNKITCKFFRPSLFTALFINLSLYLITNNATKTYGQWSYGSSNYKSVYKI
jgi:hypothetical protein